MNQRAQPVVPRSLAPVGRRCWSEVEDACRHWTDCLTTVRDRLVSLIEHESLPGFRKGRYGLKVDERAYAGQVLGQLGDPRPGVGVVGGLPDIDWIEIPPGKFLMGGRRSSQGSLKFTCELIESAYRISRYPITVAQYQAFVDDKGYDESRFWTKAGWEWRTREQIASPRDQDPVFQTPNHPRVGVCFFEAVAFCRWLSEKLGRDVRLPSEAQWERAARGEQGRHYPWGDATNFAKRCNCDTTDLDHTSAVGLFPSGNAECGAADLAGNALEWCSTAWLPDYIDYKWSARDDPEGYTAHVLRSEISEDGEVIWRCDPERYTARVVRGGSWFGRVPDCLMSSHREWHAPDDRYGSEGFRCVCAGA